VTTPPWAHKVSWERADIFQPDRYAPLLRKADFVVHSMGILLEADYKGVISGRESPIAGLRKAFSPAKASAAPGNPLERARRGEELRPPESDRQLTYEMMNRDSAVVLAQEADKAEVGTFAYISAAAGAPVLPARYITTKREAEEIIADGFPRMRGLFFRPPFMYDGSRAFTIPMAAMTGAGALFNNLTGGALSGFMGAAGVKPLKVDVVAEAVVEALGDDTVRGTIEVPRMEELANKAWRKGML